MSSEPPLYRQIGLQILFLRRRATLELNARLAPLNASAPMYNLLFRLANEPDAPQHELASDAGLDPGAVSRLVSKLSSDGIVQTRQDPADRRVRRVSLTTKGARLEQSLAPVVDEALSLMSQALSEEEQLQLLSLLRKAVAATPGLSEAAEETARQSTSEPPPADDRTE
jgi:DNA-binding MarR family transcriptional regulator